MLLLGVTSFLTQRLCVTRVRGGVGAREGRGRYRMGEQATAQEYAVLLTCLLRRPNQSPNLTLEVHALPCEG